MSFFKRKRREAQAYDSKAPVLAAVIKNPVTSEIFQDILKENCIPFICRQDGAGGSVKLLFGGGIVPDSIYVSAENEEAARELYRAYLETEIAEETDTED